MTQCIDLSNQRFGRLVVIERASKIAKKMATFVGFVCVIVAIKSLLRAIHFEKGLHEVVVV